MQIQGFLLFMQDSMCSEVIKGLEKGCIKQIHSKSKLNNISRVDRITKKNSKTQLNTIDYLQ